MHKHLLPLALLSVALLAAAAHARTTLKSVCRLKGQEENTIQGLGLVVGLKGTGDGGGFQSTMRSLEKVMRVMGEPLGERGLAELKDSKNAALVIVTATIPAAGARQGDKLDCSVSSIGAAKSLAGGRLFLTALIGPDKTNPRVYALAEGAVVLDDPSMPTSGVISQGCRLEDDFINAFVKDNRVTLVLDKNHADFQVAQDVAETINDQLSFQSSGQPLARAINQVNVEVGIPPQYRDDPVLFVSQILALPILEPQTTPRVVINERAGTIVISGDVEIGAVVVSHKGIVVEAGNAPAGGPFVSIDPSGQSQPKLKSLVEALNAVHASTDDVIDIVKGLDRNGKLHAQLVVE